MKKRIITLAMTMFATVAMLASCGKETTKKPVVESEPTIKPTVESETTSIAEKETVPTVRDESLFEIKDGTLVRYTGGFQKEMEIVLPSQVKTIGRRAFSLSKKERKIPIGNLKMIHLTIPKDVKLEEEAFTQMGPMTITFEEGRKRIEKRAFFGSVHKTIASKVILPDSVEVLEKYCFHNSLGGSFLSIEMGNGVREIKEGALYGVAVDKIPDSVVHIGRYAFYDWGYLPNDLPEGVKTLGPAFAYLIHGKIKIPSTVTKIARDAVGWDESADDTGYIVAEGNKHYYSDEDGCLYRKKDGKRLYRSGKCD